MNSANKIWEMIGILSWEGNQFLYIFFCCPLNNKSVRGERKHNDRDGEKLALGSGTLESAPSSRTNEIFIFRILISLRSCVSYLVVIHYTTCRTETVIQPGTAHIIFAPSAEETCVCAMRDAYYTESSPLNRKQHGIGSTDRSKQKNRNNK